MTLQTDIQELDGTIASNTKILELHKALERLNANPDFQKVIGEGYFNAEAVRLVHLKADIMMASPEKQASIISQMDSIGNLAAYLKLIRHQGETAEKTVSDAIIDRNALMSEGP